MRHPSSKKKDDDLSRLTTSASSSSSSVASRGENNFLYQPDNSELISSRFTSSYLPEIIDPIELQISSRKRKERQDSTSSTTQDRKLIRSNSEEYIPSSDREVIRRVYSHEEFKHPLRDKTNFGDKKNGGKSVQQSPLQQQQQQHQLDDHDGKVTNNEVQEILRETHRHAETSPARSRTFDFSHKYRLSPHRDGRQSGRSSDETDGEHERRRSSERSCRARAPQGRKMQSSKKPTKHLAAKLRERDENVYKYDSCDRRGFVGRSLTQFEEHHSNGATSSSYPPKNIDNNGDAAVQKISPKSKKRTETLPWERSLNQDDLPVVCPRFADSTFNDVVAVQNRNIAGSNNGLKSLSNFTDVENFKTREIMKQNLQKATHLLLTPEEQLETLQKRLGYVKKRIANFEHNFKRSHGKAAMYEDKMNDLSCKKLLLEYDSLQKEKQLLRAHPKFLLGYKLTLEGGTKMEQMQNVINEIEKHLQDKRDEEDRPIIVDDMTPIQLVQEKTAIQRSLLHYEGLFGRPKSKDERDIARLLYDRYRAVKRSVNRKTTFNVAGVSVSELPTILEHEVMQFTQQSFLLETPTDQSSSVQESSSDTTDATSSAKILYENVHTLSLDQLWNKLEIARTEKKKLRRAIKEFEEKFEERNGRKMLKSDRSIIEDKYQQYKQVKSKLRLFDALAKKHMSKQTLRHKKKETSAILF